MGTLAEGVGFEPTEHLAMLNGFQDSRIRPLCHPYERYFTSWGFEARTSDLPCEGLLSSAPYVK